MQKPKLLLLVSLTIALRAMVSKTQKIKAIKTKIIPLFTTEIPKTNKPKTIASSI
jgi:hypothetical protein